MDIHFETYVKRKPGGKQPSEDKLVGQSGAYVIKHERSGKVYVGSSKNLAKRLQKNMWDLSKGSHKNRHLQAAYLEDSSVSVKYVTTDTETGARVLEQMLVDYHLANGGVFNIAVQDVTKTRIGVKLAPEHIEALKRGNANKTLSDETRMRMRSSRLKYSHGPETFRKLSSSLKAFNATPEGKAMRAAAVAKLSRKCKIDGVTYHSIAEAARITGIPHQLISYRLHSKIAKWANYMFVEDN